MQTHYDLLGVRPNASPDEIRSAYLLKARQFHPDVNRGSVAAEMMTKMLNNAYEVLKNPVRRHQYDQEIRFTNKSTAYGMHAPAIPGARKNSMSMPHPNTVLNWTSGILQPFMAATGVQAYLANDTDARAQIDGYVRSGMMRPDEAEDAKRLLNWYSGLGIGSSATFAAFLVPMVMAFFMGAAAPAVATAGVATAFLCAGGMALSLALESLPPAEYRQLVQKAAMRDLGNQGYIQSEVAIDMQIGAIQAERDRVVERARSLKDINPDSALFRKDARGMWVFNDEYSISLLGTDFYLRELTERLREVEDTYKKGGQLPHRTASYVSVTADVLRDMLSNPKTRDLLDSDPDKFIMLLNTGIQQKSESVIKMLPELNSRVNKSIQTLEDFKKAIQKQRDLLKDEIRQQDPMRPTSSLENYNVAELVPTSDRLAFNHATEINAGVNQHLPVAARLSQNAIT